MNNGIRITVRRLLLAAAGLLGLCGSACVQERRPVETDPLVALEERVQVPDGTPAELTTAMEDAARGAVQLTNEPERDDRKSLPTAEFRLKMLTGIRAAEKLADHPDSDESQRQTGRQAKLALLYLGVQNDEDAFYGRFSKYVEHLCKENPQSEEAALGKACLLEWKHLSGRPVKEEVMPLLVDYAETYPANKAGINLFRVAGKKLETRGDRAGARSLYEKGLALYGQHPDVKTLSRRLEEMQREDARSAARRHQRKQATEAAVAEIRTRLGNHEDGYFVVYAEQKVKPPRHGGMYFYRYEYEVLQGLTAVVDYDAELPETWSWNLVQRFPATPDGRKNAYDLWKKLLKKKRTGKD